MTINKEKKDKIRLYMEKVKDYEIYGGQIVDFKETLTNLREAIKNSLSLAEDWEIEKLVKAIDAINDTISWVDSFRLVGTDEEIEKRKIIEALASELMKKPEIMILDLMAQ
jgi:hypothetical protein